MSGAGRDQRGADEESRYQQQLADLQGLLRLPLAKGRALKGLQLTAGNNFVAHGLGRAPQGWFATRSLVDALVAREIPPSGSDYDPKKHLKLLVLSACTVDLWVF